MSKHTARVDPELRDLVRRHEVCYEVWPEIQMEKSRRVQVGFDLELCGTKGHDSPRHFPSGAEYRQIYGDLQQIAMAIAPRDDPEVRCEIAPFDRAVRETSVRGFRPEVVLGITITHRHGADRPVDDCEQRCLRTLQTRLAQIGVGRGRWSPRRR